jgi:hypothetical protein
MKVKSLLAKPFANYIAKKIAKESSQAVLHQNNLMTSLIKSAAKTNFGADHHFSKIENYADFTANIPLRDYEQLSHYIEQIKQGKHNVLWPGVPIYFAKSSGTTSGIKYIPITKDSISNHIDTARNALLLYMHQTDNTSIADGRMIFLSGSPELEKIANIPTGRLSGIVNHHIPYYLRKNQLPAIATNCIEDWEVKLKQIVEETHKEDMTLISGIPPWVQMYFDSLKLKTGKLVGELFPNFSVLVYGGVNFEPYKEKLLASIGRKIDTIETYPASEGFIAFQDSQTAPGLLLNTNSGIFFEFVLLSQFFDKSPTRIKLDQIELNVNYVIILNSNAGLFGYVIGDTVKFINNNPYRILVTGRIKHFISAFGEHVIAEEVENAIKLTMQIHSCSITEFTVAPQIINTSGLPFHQWLIEFEKLPDNINLFAAQLDVEMRKLNIYYDDLIAGNILQPLIIKTLPKNSFINYMKNNGKLGGQNKVPRLSNDRTLADEILTGLDD